MGASNIELISIKGGTHFSSLFPMIQNFFPWFEKMNS
jgi:hypothetical protein